MADIHQAPGEPGGIDKSSASGGGREETRLRILSRFALDLFDIPTEAELFRYVTREAAGKLGLENSSIYLPDPGRGLLYPVAASGDAADLADSPIGESVTREAVERGEAIFYDCDGSAGAGLCVPLVVNDEPIGTLCCKSPRNGAFGREEQEVLNTVAAMTGARLGLLRKDAALRASEKDFRSLFETSSCGIGRSLLADGRVIRANRKLAEIFGYDSPESFIAKYDAATHYVDPADRHRLIESARRAPGVAFECSLKKRDGSIVTVQIYPEISEELGVLNFASIDISQHVQMVSELRENQALVQALVKHSPVALSIKELDGSYSFVSPSYGRYLGIASETAIGRPSQEFLSPETVRVLTEADEKVRRTGVALQQDEGFQIEIGPYTLLVTKFPILDQDGDVTAIGTVGIDISDRRAAEDQLRQSEKLLKETARLVKVGSWQLGADGKLVWSEETMEIFGVTPEEFAGNTKIFYERVHPEDRQMVWQVTEEAWRRGVAYDCVHRIVLPDGTIRTVREGAEVIRNDDGETVGLIGAVQDITESLATEARLHQAQKMEAVGQLTGGVAHDFNNLLMVIQGNAEMLDEMLEGKVAPVRSIIKAANRGAELTYRLLAFSRRQTLQPRPVNLVELLSGMKTLLERSLGETIKIDIRSDEKVPPALADPGQVENALLNLALNSRDAMPRGGKLTIQCEARQLDETYVEGNADLRAGDYVLLAVSDEGTGMSEEVQQHIFEPFFTTKEVGEGSGLGLSMVYGFAKQSGGHVSVYSEEGKGTTIKLYLPAAEQTSVREPRSVVDEIPRGDGETILVIEDNPDVRELAENLLVNLGYRVIASPEAASAERMLAAGYPIDLVLSDVVLPGGTSGPEFAERVRADYTDLPIIFMSGYPAEAAKRNGFVGSDAVLLNKPFQRRALAQAVRDALRNC